MNLKRIITEQRILASGVVNAELVLPGEPLIYSIKYPVGMRKRGLNFFRAQQWKSLFKSFFPSYYNTKTPVVVVVRFYVSPPSDVVIKAADLKKESIPAVMSYELCDYLLSFIEMLMHVLINSYRQIVKIDMEKYYSNKPRTVFKFIKWDHYVKSKDGNSVCPKAKNVSARR